MFNLDSFMDSLLISGKGIAGIFIVILVIIIFVLLLEILFPQKDKKQKQ